MEEVLEENSNIISLLFSFIYYNYSYYLLNKLNNMKDWHFRVIVAIIIIQSIYLSVKFKSIERWEESNYSSSIENSINLTHIKNTTEQTLEITAKYAN